MSPPRRRFPERRCGFPGAGVDTGVDGKVGAGAETAVEAETEAEAGGAGAMAAPSSWTSGRGVVRRAGAEPIPMAE